MVGWATMRRTYIDANVLISAFRGNEPSATRALEVLDDPDRRLVVSNYLRLEVLRKPLFHGHQEEVEFMQLVFDRAEVISTSDELTSQAVSLAAQYDLGPLDALHVSAAVIGQVDELVTLEKGTKPLCRVREVTVVSLYSGQP